MAEERGSVDGCGDRRTIVKSWAARRGLMCSLFFYLKIREIRMISMKLIKKTFIGKI
jgi:hypothetical protein